MLANMKKGSSRVQRAHPSKSLTIMVDGKQDNQNKKVSICKKEPESNGNPGPLISKIGTFLPHSVEFISYLVFTGKEIPKLLQGRFRSLWRGNQCNFQMERQYNELIGSFYPHCAVCSVIWPVSVSFFCHLYSFKHSSPGGFLHIS